MTFEDKLATKAAQDAKMHTSECQVDVVVRRKSFDIEKHNGKYYIYTSEWKENCKNIWTATEISEKRLKEITENIKRLNA